MAAAVGTAHAQDAPRFGLKAGVSLANIAGKDLGKGFSSLKDFSNLVGANAGVMADFSLSDHFSIHPELLFSQKGAKITNTDSYSNGSIAVFSTTTGQVRLSYLDLPVLGRGKFGGFFVEAGPQVGFLMAQKHETTTTAVYTAGGIPVTETSSDKDDSRNGTSKFDLGYVLGVGYQLPQGLELGVRYNGGISNLDDSKGASDDFRVRNSVFQFQVGYLFGGK